MTQYAAKTDVTSDRSRSEIERTLIRYGADQFAYGWKEDNAIIAFRKDGRHIRFILPLPKRDDPAFTSYMRGQFICRRNDDGIAKLYEQAVRQRWRALGLIIKAKLEAIETGIVTFEDEFMAQIVLPDGKTVGEWMHPQIEQVYLTGQMPSDLPMLEDRT